MILALVLGLGLVVGAGAGAGFPVNWRTIQIPPSAAWRAPAKLPAPPTLAIADEPTEEGFRALVLACDRDDIAACSRAADRLRAPKVRADTDRIEKLLAHACDLHFGTCADYAGFLLQRDGLDSEPAQKILTYRCYAYGLCAEAAWLTILRGGVASRKEAVRLFERHPGGQNPVEADIAYAKAITACDLGTPAACVTEHAIGIEACLPQLPAYHAKPTFLPGPATKIRERFGKNQREALHADCWDRKIAEGCALEKALHEAE